MPDQFGNETPAERRRRERAEKSRERREFIEKARKDEEKRIMGEQELSAWEEAIYQGGPSVEKYLDAEMRDLLGAGMGEIVDEIRNAPDSKDKQEVMEIIAKAQKKAKGGMFSSGDRKGASKSLRRNKDKIKKVAKEGKKAKGGCAVLAVAGVGTLVATLWGMYEGASAIVGALWG